MQHSLKKMPDRASLLLPTPAGLCIPYMPEHYIQLAEICTIRSNAGALGGH